MLVDMPDGFVIRPFEARFPNGAPPRDAVSCLGIPIDENEKYRRRDEMLTRLAVQRGEQNDPRERPASSVLKSMSITAAP
jgi:hypothetical protein